MPYRTATPVPVEDTTESGVRSFKVCTNEPTFVQKGGAAGQLLMVPASTGPSRLFVPVGGPNCETVGDLLMRLTSQPVEAGVPSETSWEPIV